LNDTKVFLDPIANGTIKKTIMENVMIEIPKQIPETVAGALTTAASTGSTLSKGSVLIILANLFGGVGMK
jgi:hypothetical protein